MHGKVCQFNLSTPCAHTAPSVVSAVMHVTSAYLFFFFTKFAIPWGRDGPIPAGSQDETLGKELWDWCEEQVKDL